MRIPIRNGGFTLLEAVVGALVAAVLVLGVLAAWDLAARMNKSEIEIADAQGSLRFALTEIARAAATAGAGGLFVTQAVLLRPDPGVPGMSISDDGDYDNVAGGTITELSGSRTPIRPGTDVFEVRGVLFSPLLALDSTSGCGTCAGVAALTARAVTETGHVNDHSRRPQFSRIDEATRGASGAHPMLVLVADGQDLHPGCADAPEKVSLPPQRRYAVGRLSAPTALAAAGTFGQVDFGDALAREMAIERPDDPAPPAAVALLEPRRAGVLDDVVFFVDDTDPYHPRLARALRRGDRFDVAAIAEDVEDLQVAYGVDGLYGSDAVAADGVLRRTAPLTPTDPDPDFSTQIDGDEWAPNTPGERPFEAADFRSAAHCPRLRAIAASLVAKSHDPDPSYRGLDSFGIRVANSPDEVRAYPNPPASPRYRRRSQTIRVAVRNYQ